MGISLVTHGFICWRRPEDDVVPPYKPAIVKRVELKPKVRDVIPPSDPGSLKPKIIEADEE